MSHRSTGSSAVNCWLSPWCSTAGFGLTTTRGRMVSAALFPLEKGVPSAAVPAMLTR
jgi:hypothetical protein